MLVGVMLNSLPELTQRQPQATQCFRHAPHSCPQAAQVGVLSNSQHPPACLHAGPCRLEKARKRCVQDGGILYSLVGVLRSVWQHTPQHPACRSESQQTTRHTLQRCLFCGVHLLQQALLQEQQGLHISSGCRDT